jgi:hypothetical protein
MISRYDRPGNRLRYYRRIIRTESISDQPTWKNFVRVDLECGHQVMASTRRLEHSTIFCCHCCKEWQAATKR